MTGYIVVGLLVLAFAIPLSWYWAGIEERRQSAPLPEAREIKRDGRIGL